MDDSSGWFTDWTPEFISRRMKDEHFYARPMWGDLEPIGFVPEAKQELLRLIVDVQQNRNRPEGM